MHGAILPGTAPCTLEDQDEGATRLQGVEEDRLVAVANLPEVNPLACMRWQVRERHHRHSIRRRPHRDHPMCRETRRAQSGASRTGLWAAYSVLLPRWRRHSKTRKTKENQEKQDQVYDRVFTVSNSTVYVYPSISTVSRSSWEQCYSARGVYIFSFVDFRSS